jgi:surface antigen
MSNVTHGMNVDEVDALGGLLQSKADQLRHLIRDLEAVLSRTVWDGPDAVAFKQQWWPDHRGRLQAVAEQVHGFGQSALNNATEQRTASGVTPGGGSRTTSAGSGPVPTTPSSASPDHASGGYPAWGQPISDDEAKRIADEFIPKGERHHYDFSGEGGKGDNWYQCTAWAKARWRQMGYTGPDWRGDGGAVASNINRLLGRPDSTTPTVGAIASRPGHVAVVEAVRVHNGQVQARFSEMNMGDGDGRWGNSSLDSTDVAAPGEFRVSDWTAVDGRYRFAAFPG